MGKTWYSDAEREMTAKFRLSVAIPSFNLETLNELLLLGQQAYTSTSSSLSSSGYFCRSSCCGCSMVSMPMLGSRCAAL
ncbi:hypothetical protein O6P43_007882 [Quillaja saponaria]|uniref:Uncharacterized protein n=1 Tax=Quillaja saponaria TaxID=32244 RepID=A0AAD7M4B8_QUISA|nr:hypothetical protein O6P43_007882 [Quillaja saponaria]